MLWLRKQYRASACVEVANRWVLGRKRAFDAGATAKETV